MKISDRIYRYRIDAYSFDGLCRLRVYVNSDNEVFALLTSLGENNPSASIMNSIEKIMESLIEDEFVPSDTKFIEHYELEDSGKDEFLLIDQIDDERFNWKKLSKNEVVTRFECSIDEFTELTHTNNRLLGDIERLLTEINPAIYGLNSVSSDKLKRLIEIRDGYILKEDIQKLIDDGSNERELQKLLKKDLSVFGEIYGHPSDDYICFSEFEIDGGFVDFVVFTGVSYMDVVLIEVKGADFNLFNKGHYDKVSSKIENASDQIRNRLRYITRNLDHFRDDIHNVRKRVEHGETVFNSFIGPNDHLEVSSEKDLTIHSVIIGGRTVDDLKESEKRYDYISEKKMNLKLESWDTWIRKLRR